MKRSLILTALSFLVLTQLIWAQVPATMSYQGVLRDVSTKEIVADGDYSLRFKLFDGSDPLPANMVWSGEHSAFNTVPVAVSGGVFNVPLGLYNDSNTLSSLPFDKQYFLQISIWNGAGWDDMTPLTRLRTVPYAFTADRLSSPATSLDAPGTGPDSALYIDSGGGTHVTGVMNLEFSDVLLADPSRGNGGRAIVHIGDGTGTDDGLVLNFDGDFEMGVNIHGPQLIVDSNLVITNGTITIPATERWYAIPGPEFALFTGNRSVDTLNYYVYSPWGDTRLTAGVHLPHGAEITELRAWVEDSIEDTVTSNFSIDLWHITPGWTPSSIASITTTGSQAGIQDPFSGVTHQVDNQSSTYLVTAAWRAPSWPNEAALKLYSVRIKYTVNQPLP